MIVFQRSTARRIRVGKPRVRVWIKLLEIPKPLLYASILLFATLGVYSLSNSLVDVPIMYTFGVIGFVMRRCDFPVGPVVLGVILGPLMEKQFRDAVSINQGDLSIFVTRPSSLSILLAAVGAVLLPYVPRIIARLRGKGDSDRLVFGGGDED
ncbi:MAG: tripartite tricarboxylate transporter permease [Chloroflexi bacterium]|nr:tripartite tricarboxylate transporter permease [Chloroflexota bacterium]